MEQMFGTNNHYVQDDGCGHEIICALQPVNSTENTALYSTCLVQGFRLAWPLPVWEGLLVMAKYRI